jgi:hypothetical protein
MKQKTQKKSTKHVTPDTPSRNHHHILPIALVIILVLAVFIGMTHFYDISPVGKASYITETPTTPFELDLLGSKEVAFDKVQKWAFVVTTSNMTEPVQYDVQTVLAKNGLLNYYVRKGTSTIAQGLLDEKLLGSTPLYLDQDSEADVTFSVANTRIMVTNGNFVEPKAADIFALNSKKEKLTLKTFSAEKSIEIKMYFTALAEAQPKLEAFWKQDGKLVPITKEFVLGKTSSKNAEAAFTWTPIAEGVHTLVIKATIGNKVATEEYRFTVGNLIYSLNETNVPELYIKKTATGLSYDIILKATKNDQPVSLPCGTVDLKKYGASIHAVSAWDEKIGQFKPNIPSEFDDLVAGKGYLVELKEIKSLSISGSCSIKSSELPSLYAAPTLKTGFNLISITGDKNLEFNKLKKPPGTTIDATYVITNEKPTSQTITELQPGKVYWVVVK